MVFSFNIFSLDTPYDFQGIYIKRIEQFIVLLLQKCLRIKQFMSLFSEFINCILPKSFTLQFSHIKGPVNLQGNREPLVSERPFPWLEPVNCIHIVAPN